MKLLTSTGLLYSAVQSQTVDGHYGTFPEVDWTTFVAEAVGSATAATSLGLNPMIRSLETTYDGGKVMSGYGWFTGTTVTGWMMKLYGTLACGGGAVTSVASGYNTFTVGTSASATDCLLKTHWVWSALSQANVAGGNLIGQSTLVVDAVEEWKNGSVKGTNNVAGDEVIYFATGGVNARSTFGLGIWHFMMWAMDKTGLACNADSSNCGAFVDVVGSGAGTGEGYSGRWVNVNSQINNGTNTGYLSALNVQMQNVCGTSLSMWSKQQAADYNAQEPNVVVAGYTGSQTTCLDYVTDEISVSGIYFLVMFQQDFTMNNSFAQVAATGVITETTAANTVPKQQLLGTSTITEPTSATHSSYVPAAKPLDTSSIVTGTLYSWNFGVPKQVVSVKGQNSAALAGGADKQMACLVLFSAPEQYGKSALIGHNNQGADTNPIVENTIKEGVANTSWTFTQANHGMIQHVWPFSSVDSVDAQGLWNMTDTHVAYTGMRLGKGIFSLILLSATRGEATAADLQDETTPTAPIWMSSAASGVNYVGANAYTRLIKSPTGGIAQFKGLTQTADNDQYVEVNCRKIAPYFGNVAWKDISNTTTTTATSGFLITCMTGISQCVSDISVAVAGRTAANSLLTAAEHATCLNDPRYLNWRQMSISMTWQGVITWWRTDSFWDPTTYVVASSWGPGTVMSSHISIGTDNTTITSTDMSKSYVFALADGSGVQLSHITGGSAVVVAPTANTSAGSGANTLTTSPSTFNNSSPNRVDQNYCSSTNLNLTGLADTSSLASSVTAYSDGYQATITMTLDWIQAGAQGGWRGVCMVYYTSQYIQDDTNGAVCMAAVQSTGTGMGSDLGGVYLIHVPATTWQPPANVGSVNPASLALTDAKYGIVNTPSSATYTYTGGYYASSAWYQPKYASSYADIARFGKDRYTGAYCMQGSGASSYFSAPAAGVQLQSAVKLAAGAIALGSAILAM